jgi:SAM-dependent methyltransferase
MSGSGRFLIPFLERGIDIDGVDASPHMLQACRNHCQRKGLIPVLYQQLLQELNLPRQYGYIFIPASSFGLIADRQAATDSLRRMYEYLRPGGKLVLEVQTPRAQPKGMETWHEYCVTRPDGAEIIVNFVGTYDPQEQVVRTIQRYELFSNGRLIETEAEDFEVRFYKKDEFQQLLRATGFINIRATKAYENVTPDLRDTTVVFECRKPFTPTGLS